MIAVNMIFLHPDDECDTEVPYADITITVRGVSTPELSQVNCLTIGEVNATYSALQQC